MHPADFAQVLLHLCRLLVNSPANRHDKVHKLAPTRPLLVTYYLWVETPVTATELPKPPAMPFPLCLRLLFGIEKLESLPVRACL
jgi:hypothetical protein